MPAVHSHNQSSRLGLVLGAGGPVGHAYHAGLLRGLAEATGWDPRASDVIMGTSAGAQIAALLRAGMTASDLAARVSGRQMSKAGEELAVYFIRPEHHPENAGREEQMKRAYRPGSSEYLKQLLKKPWKIRPGRMAAALLPHGQVQMHPQAKGLYKLFGDKWPERQLVVTAVEMHSGRLVGFGLEGAPETDVGTAVSSSGAVPGVRQPVQIGNGQYVDGGMASATNLPLIYDEDLDAVLVVSPLSMYGGPMKWLVRREIRKLRKSGKEVVLLEPSGLAARAMGWNCMDLERAGDVARGAYASALRELERPEVRRVVEHFAP